jgi:hypothetical protein
VAIDDGSFGAFMKTYKPSAPTGTAAVKDPPVYMGFHGDHEAQAPASALTVPSTSALNQFYTWSDDERAAWGRRLYSAGYLKNPDDFDDQLKGWAYAVENASNYYTGAGKQMTPWAFIDMKIATSKVEEHKPYQGPRTQTSVNLPSKTDANAAIQAMFKNELGREATDGELDRYRSIMLAQYKKNPTITTTTPTKFGENGEVIDSTSTTKGGFNPQGWLEDQAQADPEYGAYQAASTYYNALQSALGPIANL